MNYKIQPSRKYLLLEHGADKYVFIYDNTPEDRGEVLRTLNKFATNPELSFTWYDAAHLSQTIRAEAAKEYPMGVRA